MITVEFMVMCWNKSHVFRLSTNITITSAVWLLGTLYINLNFDNLIVCELQLNKQSHISKK